MGMNENKCPNCGWSKTYEIDKSNSYNLLIEVSNENERLAQQLQAYKDKEEKIIKKYIKLLKHYKKVKENSNMTNRLWCEGKIDIIEDFLQDLQILNEGE